MIERARGSVVQVGRGGRCAGAGVVWRGEPGENLVLTNDHVIAGGPRGGGRRGGGRRRDGGVRVTLGDGRTFDAEVVKRGRALDLALLRVVGDPGDLPTVPVGDSDALRVGELVYAIGHPWGRLGAVTAGVVSGLGAMRGSGGPGRGRRDRRSPEGGIYPARYVHSDVALAPGNSGGPLLNARGEVVGINAMVFGDLAISIPSNAAVSWLAEAGEGRPRLGVGLVPAALPASLTASLGRGEGEIPEADPAPEAGLVVAAVKEGGPADRAGIVLGDVLVGVGGPPLRPLRDVEALLDALARGGETVRLRVLRGGKMVSVDVVLQRAGRAA